MQNNITQILFALLRSAVSGDRLTEQEKILYSQEMFPKLMGVARKHAVEHLLVYGLSRNGFSMEEKSWQREQLKTVCHVEQKIYEQKRIYRALENAEIPFVPLKGTVLRQYYPEAWMRSSVDMDILVPEEQIDKAVEYLIKECAYTYECKGDHDVILWSPGKHCLELHYSLMPSDFDRSYSGLLSKVWQYTVPNAQSAYHWELTDDMFYFYHVAHMAKHFELGGCGIRPFIDLWILEGIPGADRERRDALLAEGGLLRFANAARALSRVWFGEAAHTEITQKMERYILRGGLFGSVENAVAVGQQRQGNKLKYILSRVFLPYTTLKYQFPCLQKHKWLTPLFQVVRWFRLLLPARSKKALQELRKSSKHSAEEARQMQVFLENIGL